MNFVPVQAAHQISQKHEAPLKDPYDHQIFRRIRSDDFINQLGSIARENNAALIVDETNTGCGASGKGFFQYQGKAADYVTFGRRSIVTGYFSKEDIHAPNVHLGGSQLDLA